jgi:conjugative relaxase-like TrwC/TraI family protein
MVSSISKVTQGSEWYYTKLAREDYYSAGGEPPGVFLGKGADKLKLTGFIYHKDKRLHDLFQGLHPHDGSVLRHGACAERIYQTKDGKEKVHSSVCAYDFTLSAPKSVSVLWATADRETQKKIEAAHDCAVRQVAKYLEERACYTRTGSGGSIREKVAPIFAAFQHSTSRELDPQLHSHLLVINTALRENGRGGALDGRELLKRQFTTGEIYRNTLRYQLSKELGLRPIDKQLEKGWSFELRGIPETLCQEFSKRRKQIEAVLNKEDTPKQVQVKVLATRKTKLYSIKRDDLFAVWRGVAREHGFHAKDFMEQVKKENQFTAENSRFRALNSAIEEVSLKIRLEEYRLKREQYWQRIDRDFEKARLRSAKRQRRYRRKMIFLYATGKISRTQYRMYTEDRESPRSKLGINFAYATHQISRSQQLYLLGKYGHRDREQTEPRDHKPQHHRHRYRTEPKTKIAINWEYATHRISEGQRLYLMFKYDHLKKAEPKLPPGIEKQDYEAHQKEWWKQMNRREHERER